MAFVCALLLVAAANAQSIRPPESGGQTSSLGQPLRWRWQAGLAAGPINIAANNDLLMRAHVGVARDLLNPVAGLARLAAEAYAGVRDTRSDAGARAILHIPYIGMGVGADYNLRTDAVDLLITAQSPVRRGGLLTRGSMLRLDWYPERSHSFTIGITAPLGDPLAGRGRPLKDYVVVSADFQPRVPYRVDEPALEAMLDSLRSSAEWIRREVTPFLDQDGRDAKTAVGRSERYLRELRARLAVRSAEQEVRYFHSQLEELFTLTAGSAAGSKLARRAREILLEDVLLPYNNLVGRKKRKDTLAEFGTVARGRFSRWVVSSGLVPAGRTDPALYAFQRLTDIMDEVRNTAVKEWDDPRLVWLPLQYALLPEQHDEPAELDKLLERATGIQFTNHNRILYIANLQFHSELLRTIRETNQYHVLWIHDFPAVTPAGAIDEGSFTQVVDGYLTTLAERVEAYDVTGVLPTYFIFVDEFYYEERKSRMLMTVLEDPLEGDANLPRGTGAAAERLARVRERLRTAVSNSRVLQAEARQYGEPWLRNRIKVHVNVTNRADPSFWAGGLVSSLFGYPDNVMRDHRKIAFHDVHEADVSAGMAILTGMGVGQAYLGPSWDDRSLIVQGPVLFELKRAARDLLLSQGMDEQDLPTALRAQPSLSTIATPVEPEGGFDARALTLVNGTGYLPKPLNVAKALLYSLLPPGSVMKIPDSLWNSTFYGGLVLGACLRGATVSIISPGLANAPSSGSPQMARAHELMTRLLLAQRVLAEPLAIVNGHLRVGLYALEADRNGFASRIETWTKQVAASPFLREHMPFTTALMPVMSSAASVARVPRSAEPATASVARPPKLHQKVQFHATREYWDTIGKAPEWPVFMATYLRYREATYSVEGESSEASGLVTELATIAERIFAHTRNTKGLSYALAGSQNQDYRGMFMDGEVGVLFSGPASLLPLVDLVFMEGTVTWVDDQLTLDRLLPPPTELQRRLGRVAKDGV
jgi:hypothetical protein